MTTDIRVKRGLRASLPVSSNNGELLVATDTREMFLGSGGGQPLLNLSKPEPKVETLDSTPTINIDASDLDVVEINLVGDCAINITNGRHGQRLSILLAQGGAGGHVASLGSGILWGTNPSSFTQSLDPYDLDTLELLWMDNLDGCFVLAKVDASTPATGGASSHKGTAILDFGTTGDQYAEVLITGQTGISSTTLIRTFMMADTTAAHNDTEHMMVPLKLTAGSIVNGSSFKIYAASEWHLTGTFKVHYIWE